MVEDLNHVAIWSRSVLPFQIFYVFYQFVIKNVYPGIVYFHFNRSSVFMIAGDVDFHAIIIIIISLKTFGLKSLFSGQICQEVHSMTEYIESRNLVVNVVDRGDITGKWKHAASVIGESVERALLREDMAVLSDDLNTLTVEIRFLPENEIADITDGVKNV